MYMLAFLQVGLAYVLGIFVKIVKYSFN